MTQETSASVRKHYERAGEDTSLLEKLTALLNAIQEPITTAQLAGLDQFHVRGLAATQQLAELAKIKRGMTVLDAGSGIGGPSRFLAEHYGYSVTGVDLTPAFVEVAQLLTERTGLSDKVSFQEGDLSALPFPDRSFDVVWTQHVVMNIRDRGKVYREFRRVLKPCGMVAFHDVLAVDDKRKVNFPVPWAAEPSVSFLLTMAETKAAFEQAGLTPGEWKDVTDDALAWFDQAPVPPPHGLSLAAVAGPGFANSASNLGKNLREGRARLVMGVAEAK